jgi:hypothetical protein
MAEAAKALQGANGKSQPITKVASIDDNILI